MALTLVVYAGVWSFHFVQFDDPQYVTANPNIANGLTEAGIRWAFTTGYAMNWHPVTWLSHMLDIQLFGLQPGPAHLVNLLLHIASTLLLFWFLATSTGALGRSAVVAALFAAHPLHVESVAWVSERKDVLSTLFWMLTLCAYLRYVKQPDWRRYAAVVAFTALGLMAKPMVVTLPFVLLLLDWWPLGRLSPDSAAPWSQRVWPLVREKLPLFALAAASSLATIVAQRSGGAVVRLDVIPFGLRLETAVVSYATYLIKMVWPVDLYMYYPHAVSVPGGQVAASAVFLIVVTVAVVAARRVRAYPTVGWLWYLGTLVPVIGLVQVGRQAMADRYTYVPLIGVFVLLVWGAADLIARWPVRRWLGPALAALVLVPCAVTARAQVQYWRNDSTLWAHALQTATGLDDRRTALVVEYLLAENNVMPLQTLLFSQAGGSSAFPPLAHQYLGQLFGRHNQIPDAIAEYQEALRLNPDLAQVHHELALLLAGQGRVDQALPHFEAAARLRPDLADAHRNLAVALAKLGRTDEAMKELREVLRLKPDDADVRMALDEFTRKSGRGGR